MYASSVRVTSYSIMGSEIRKKVAGGSDWPRQACQDSASGWCEMILAQRWPSGECDNLIRECRPDEPLHSHVEKAGKTGVEWTADSSGCQAAAVAGGEKPWCCKKGSTRV
jgi:hypothetical protein